MEYQEGTSNGDNGVWSDQKLDSEDGDNGGRIHGGNDVAEGGEVWDLKVEAVNNGVLIEDGVVRGLKKEGVDSGVAIEIGNGVAEGENVWGLKHEAVNNGVVSEGGNGIVEGEEVWGLMYETVNSGVTIGGNGVAESEEVWGLKNETVNNGMEIDGGSCVAEGKEVPELKNETVNNGMKMEGGNSVAEGEEVCLLKSGDINIGVAITDGKGIAEDGMVWDLKAEASNIGVAIADGNCVAEGAQIWGLKNEQVVIADGNGVAYSGEVQGSKNEAVNNEVVIIDRNGVAYSGEVQGPKNEAVNNEVVIIDRNSVAYSGEVRASMNEGVNSEVVIADGNAVAYSGKVQGSKKEAVNIKLVIADENGVAESDEDHSLKNGTVDNVVAADRFAVVERDSSTLACLQTYKRRKYVKLSSESRVPENSRQHMEAASHLSDKVVKKPCDLAGGNTSKDYSHDHWGNVVLKHLYHSLGNDNGGMEWCIREALMSRPKINCATTMTETFKTDRVGQECSSQLECLFHRLQSEASGRANVLHNGFCSESDGRGMTERCQHVFHNILASEKFSSLCKVLLENFQGMKPESVFDFSVINSRMEGQTYEQSPTLFLSDVQQVWRKLQNTGNQIVAIAKSLSNMSKASFFEQLGISAKSTFEDEKQVESISDLKPEQTIECVSYKVGTCRHCGDKASGTDCLVCDSCEEMYHLSCIEPPVKEIPRKSWFCANCTASGIGCRHENCVVCERLNVPKTLDGIVGEESIPTNEETLNELEENSNCTYDGIQVSMGGINSSDCKICRTVVDGEKIKICGHPFCPSKHYHVRCLSSKQIKSYGLCWYCPSCICQVCHTDKDDDKIVLCDGCDHAYHIYCMKPPRNSIPRGKWFCIKCEAGIEAIRQARKTYESNRGKVAQNDSKPNEDIDKKWNKKRARESDKVGGMDMLITAANTLNAEEDINGIQIDSKRT